MTNAWEAATGQQSLFVDQFLFYFMRLRKCHCHFLAGRIRKKYPGCSPEEQALKFVESQSVFSGAAGLLTRMVTGGKGGAHTLRLIGIGGGSVVLSRLHITMLLTIALLYGKDIDSNERVPEMLAVIAATLPATFLSASVDDSSSLLRDYASSGAVAAASSYLIGRAAIAYYNKPQSE